MYAAGGEETKKRKPREKKERPAWLKPAVCDDYKAGLTVQEITAKYHGNTTLVSQYLHEEGILGSKPKQTPPSPRFRWLIEELLKARVLLGRAPNESEITRLMKEVRHEEAGRELCRTKWVENQERWC